MIIWTIWLWHNMIVTQQTKLHMAWGVIKASLPKLRRKYEHTLRHSYTVTSTAPWSVWLCDTQDTKQEIWYDRHECDTVPIKLTLRKAKRRGPKHCPASKRLIFSSSSWPVPQRNAALHVELIRLSNGVLVDFLDQCPQTRQLSICSLGLSAEHCS